MATHNQILSRSSWAKLLDIALGCPVQFLLHRPHLSIGSVSWRQGHPLYRKNIPRPKIEDHSNRKPLPQVSLHRLLSLPAFRPILDDHLQLGAAIGHAFFSPEFKANWRQQHWTRRLAKWCGLCMFSSPFTRRTARGCIFIFVFDCSTVFLRNGQRGIALISTFLDR